MWHDLTQPFHEGIPHSSALSPPTLETVRDVDRDGINVQRYSTATHVGTHLDAPRHFVSGGATIDDPPLDRFAGEGVVLDVRKRDPEPITRSDVEAAAADVEGGVGRDDVVVFHTGWSENYGDPAYYRYPWFAAEVADWLVDRAVKLVGSDTLSPDRPRELRPENWTAYPVHRTLLAEGVLIAENLANLRALVGERVEFCAFPMKIRGGDGAPVRFVARV